MSFALRLKRWLRQVNRSLAGPLARRERRSALRITRLEDRVNPVGVANVLVNVPESNQATLNQFFTQSGTSTLTFGNTVLVTFNDSGSISTGNRGTGWGRSIDGGSTFTDMGTLSGNNDAGDPVWARDATTGRIYLATLSFTGNGFSLFRSDDNGATLQPPTQIMTSLTIPDKEWITVDNFAGTGRGNVYVVGRALGGTSGIYLSRSVDGGTTFSAPVLVVAGAAGTLNGADVIIMPDHSVQVYYYTSVSSPKIAVKRSTDFGATFGTEINVALVQSTATNGDLGLTRSATDAAIFRTNAFPQLAVNPVNGQIYLVYANRGVGADKADIIFTSSNDGGLTWTAPTRVNSDSTTRDQWQPSIQVTADGARLAVGWYDRRLDANNSLIDYFIRPATISGTTVSFGADYRVTTQSFLPEFGRDLNVVGDYMGDYDGSGLGADNSFFHVSWGDNRLGGPDVRSARIGTALAGGELISWTPTGNVGSASNVVFTFNQPMDQTSFSVAQDVVSFTRSGNSIINQITGFTWLSSTQLRVDFNSQTTSGQYVLTIGPQILTVGGVPLDDNLNGTAGEAADAVAASFNIIAAPVVTGVSIGDGINTVQRSRVSQLQVSFDQVISYVGTPTAAYTVVRTIGGVPQGAPVMIAVTTQTISGHSVATITFLDNLDFGSLSDGHYRLTVDHTQIVGMAADSVTNFHRFYGDSNGDEHVDIADFGVFSATFNLHTGQPGFLSFFDKNIDGVIDIFDFAQFSIRLFTTLP